MKDLERLSVLGFDNLPKSQYKRLKLKGIYFPFSNQIPTNTEPIIKKAMVENAQTIVLFFIEVMKIFKQKLMSHLLDFGNLTDVIVSIRLQI